MPSSSSVTESPSLNVADHVAYHARRRPHGAALRFRDRSWSYGELEACAARASNVLAAHGILPGDRVALHLPNSPAFIVAYLGALRLGAIPVAIATSWRPEAIAAALLDVAPRVIITTCTLHARLAGLSFAPDLRALFVADPTTDSIPPLECSWESLLGRARDEAPMWRARPETPAAILFSSGTTATPKGVVLSHANVATNARLKARYCGLVPGDTVALVVPLFHCFGQNAIMNAAFHAGACVVLSERFDAAMLAHEIATRNVSVVFGVPQIFNRLLDAGGVDAQSMGALRYVLSAASTLPASLAERWLRMTGLAMREAYGLTESSPFAAYNGVARHVPGTLGAPVAGVRMAVVDPECGAPCVVGERGEIVMQGHNVMLGYWNRPEETAHVLRGGWLHTGDIGYADDYRRLVLVDRMADVVKVNGFRVYPATVEAVLRAHPNVVDVTAFGIVDVMHGERLEVAVVLSPDSDTTTDALRRHCVARLAPYEVPSRVHVCSELPRGGTGKISRPELRTASSHPFGLQHALDARFTITTHG